MKTTKKETIRIIRDILSGRDEQEIRLKMFKIIKNGKRGEK